MQYYTRTYVRVGEFIFRYHFKVLEIVPDVVLGLPWLRSYSPTVDSKERYADVRDGSSTYRLSYDESRHSTKLQFQTPWKLDLLFDTFIQYLERKPGSKPYTTCQRTP